MQIRAAGPADAEAVRAIYNAEVLGATSTFDLVARSPGEQQRWMAQHQGAYPAVVAVADVVDSTSSGPEGPGLPGVSTTVLGFGSLSPYRDRPAYATTVEDSVYVDRGNRRHGVGRALLTALVRLGTEHGFHTMVARIVGANETSIRLHLACGFEVVGTEREVGRKHRQWLDVVELQRML